MSLYLTVKASRLQLSPFQVEEKIFLPIGIYVLFQPTRLEVCSSLLPETTDGTFDTFTKMWDAESWNKIIMLYQINLIFFWYYRMWAAKNQ